MATTVVEQKTADQWGGSSVVRLFDETRRRLVETGTRNRLVHVNRSNSRGNILNIVNEQSNDVHALLADGKTMRFLAIGSEKEEEQSGTSYADSTDEGFDKERYTDAHLETRLGREALLKKLLKIAREAQTAEEESGVNILYLAMGFLTWFEDKTSSVPREAPLILLPAELVRNARTSTYDIRARHEDVLTNLPLQQRLKDDFGIDLPELKVDEDWKPGDYFAEVDAVIAERQRWKIEPNAIQLGFFSFSKLLMFRDLAIDSWPEGALGSHALTRGLLYEGFDSLEEPFGKGVRLDEVLPPEKLFHVVDADASQAKVIEEVRAGRNLVVQGPPGTGKSQTITNIIAAATKDGKRVLFLAEKMAALSVVHDRLVKVGLRDVCLELHSRTANKKTVLGELARTISEGSAVPKVPTAPVALTGVRDRLNVIAEALHRPLGTTGETAYSVLGRQARYIGAGHAPPSMATDALAAMTKEDEARVIMVVERYGHLLAVEGRWEAHPFAGTRNLNLQPVDLARLGPLLGRAKRGAESLSVALHKPLEALALKLPRALITLRPLNDLLERLEGIPIGAETIARAMLSASDLPRLQETLQAGAKWKEAHGQAKTIFVDAAFDATVSNLRGPLVAGAQSFLARCGGAYRGASRELAGLLRNPIPKTAGERLELVDQLARTSLMKTLWSNQADYCRQTLGSEWRNEGTNFTSLLSIAEWCVRLSRSAIQSSCDLMLSLAGAAESLVTLREDLREAESAARPTLKETADLLNLDPTVLGREGLDGSDLVGLAARFGEMAQGIDRYQPWTELARLHGTLHAAGVADLAERMRAGVLDGAAASAELRFARAEHLWRLAIEENPVLADISMVKRHGLVKTFSELERQRLIDNVVSILAGHLSQVPQGAMGEMKVIRGEIGKKRGQIALRQLFERAGTAVQRIKPVLLMSPISVAQYLPPGVISFDLLIIDEASQVRPEDALGAIARADQIVVVGDKKQLPPSSFFDRVLADEEDDKEGDDEHPGADLLEGAAKLGSMESILTLCEARGLSSRMLTWHYRSRDPSLIEVSNREFYESGLVLPPSPLQEDPAYGLCFTQVDGVYDKGGKRDNRREGAAIVARVAEHARAHPSLSLGIVTFSFAQRNLITELLEVARRSDATLNTFLREGQAEDVFIKNIENVQGDERDVVLVSVGYGPVVPGGRLTSMSFGPVNGEGGERRLNVLFTRARVRCEVFASFEPGDIDVSRTKGEGPRILKRFLEFAKNGRLEESSPLGLEADSAFEEDVAEVIRGYGFLADPQVGSAGFRIDLGVRHPEKPGTYILAVECDGATYHSALWARERDRLRQDVLEHLGWCFHRVWSTDWFYNRRAEIERLHKALVDAREAAQHGVRITGANQSRQTSNLSAEPEVTKFELPEFAARQMPSYQRAVFPVNSWQEPHEVAVSTLADLAKRIISAEGPIHVDEVARRIAACFGKDKAGSRILAATRSALSRAQSLDRDLLSHESFWFTLEQSGAPPVRDRSAESGATLKAACISMLEIKAALTIARDDNAGGEVADLIRTAARLLGFRRVGPDLQVRITAAL
ncbi:DUF3320 domain-containing protein [Acidisoma sp. L85]|uniref:DUF3320 domain-containing protein n=1 Tax=Acidisoma sp. L85 TaxID=1641850 RepID=UPI00131D2DEA|nr:DUF3320 domain-containing protein [Acidisoma sp. L85]